MELRVRTSEEREELIKLKNMQNEIAYLKEMNRRTNKKLNQLYEIVGNGEQKFNGWDVIKRDCEATLIENGISTPERYKFMPALSQIVRTTLEIDRVDKINAENFDKAKRLANLVMEAFKELR